MTETMFHNFHNSKSWSWAGIVQSTCHDVCLSSGYTLGIYLFAIIIGIHGIVSLISYQPKTTYTQRLPLLENLCNALPLDDRVCIAISRNPVVVVCELSTVHRPQEIFVMCNHQQLKVGLLPPILDNLGQ